MLNWDWVRNCPKSPASPQEAFEPGWWLNAKKLLKNPLIDPHVADDKLAAWIDAHTMRVHHRLLKNLGAVRAGAVAGSYELDTSTGYGAQLKALNP